MNMELEDSEFRAVINEINQVTVPKTIREKFSLNSKDEIILKFTGIISKKEKRIKPVIVKPTEDNKEDK